MTDLKKHSSEISKNDNAAPERKKPAASVGAGVWASKKYQDQPKFTNKPVKK